jgi:hypothetical protein
MKEDVSIQCFALPFDSPFEFAHETHESRQYKSKLAGCITIAITHPFRSHGALTRMG